MHRNAIQQNSPDVNRNLLLLSKAILTTYHLMCAMLICCQSKMYDPEEISY